MYVSNHVMVCLHAHLELGQEVLLQLCGGGSDCHRCVQLLQLVPACLRPAADPKFRLKILKWDCTSMSITHILFFHGGAEEAESALKE
jgi:hypothetical protein